MDNSYCGIKHKVFVSYKYKDANVYQWGFRDLSFPITARNYVNELEELSKRKDLIIYKGEKDGEDLSGLNEETIWEKLKDKIFDSTLTIVFISPNMRENKPEREQWIPWEVYFSLRHKTRDERTSAPNALLYVVLPDINNSYEYVKTMKHFEIIERNSKNGYAEFVEWKKFIENMEQYIDKAYQRRD